MSIDLQRLEYQGRALASHTTLAECHITNSTTVTLHKEADHALPVPEWPLRPASPSMGYTMRGQRSRSKSPLLMFSRETEAEKQGLQLRANAIALRGWNGIIPVSQDSQ